MGVNVVVEISTLVVSFVGVVGVDRAPKLISGVSCVWSSVAESLLGLSGRRALGIVGAGGIVPVPVVRFVSGSRGCGGGSGRVGGGRVSLGGCAGEDLSGVECRLLA